MFSIIKWNNNVKYSSAGLSRLEGHVSVRLIDMEAGRLCYSVGKEGQSKQTFLCTVAACHGQIGQHVVSRTEEKGDGSL